MRRLIFLGSFSAHAAVNSNEKKERVARIILRAQQGQVTDNGCNYNSCSHWRLPCFSEFWITLEALINNSIREGFNHILSQVVGENSSLNLEPANVAVVIGLNNTIESQDNEQSAQRTVASASLPEEARMFESGTLDGGNAYTGCLRNVSLCYYCEYRPA